MKTSICTLFENNFHHGVASLVNSLYHSGFEGDIWCGYRGSLPPWTNQLTQIDKLTLHFISLDTNTHFTNYKPTWMLSIFEHHDPSVEALLYFDPDITVRAPWNFFISWVQKGICLCQDVNHHMSPMHPIRLEWIEWLQQHNQIIKQELNTFFNGGFIGINKTNQTFLKHWQDYMSKAEKELQDLRTFKIQDRSNKFMIVDQDTLNMATMTTDVTISDLGPDGMDFIPGGFTMSHAIGSPKPWTKSFLTEMLKGHPPTLADKHFWFYTDGPIQSFDPLTCITQKLQLKIAAFIGRAYRRT